MPAARNADLIVKLNKSYSILPHFEKICYNGVMPTEISGVGVLFPCSSMVEQEAVNFEVASSSLAGGAILDESPIFL